ncbi:MAG: hypothetical protein KJ063_14390 [Anaerolineae bacterium]|nr:hypothetical protein [Anaerolineae bacterium]
MRYRRGRRRRGDKEGMTVGMMAARPHSHPSAAPIHRYPAFAHPTNRAMRQSSLLQLQQQHGNAWVQRHLADGSLQREEEKKEGKGGESSGEAKEEGFDLGHWISGQVYDVLKKQLGEAQLKSHAKEVASKATALLMEQVKGSTGEQGSFTKAQMKVVAAALSKDLGQMVMAIFQSPQSKGLQEIILRETKQDPMFAVAMVLLGLAAAIAANADIPQLDETIKLGAGFSVGGKANLGQFRNIAAKQVQASLGYTSQYFRAGIQGGYNGEGENKGFTAGTNAAVGTEEVQFKSDFNIFQSGEFKLNAQGALDFKKLGLSTGASYSNVKGWKGVGEFRLGEKTHYLSTKVEVGGDGKVGLQFDHKLVRDLAVLSNSLKIDSNKATVVTEAQLKNLFAVEGLNVGAKLVGDLTHPSVRELGLKADLKLLGDPKDVSKPTLFITFDTSFTAGKDGKKDQAAGFLFLRGEF